MPTDDLTTTEVAKMLGCSTQWVRELAARKKLRYYQTPLGRLFKLRDVRAYMAKSSVEEASQ